MVSRLVVLKSIVRGSKNPSNSTQYSMPHFSDCLSILNHILLVGCLRNQLSLSSHMVGVLLNQSFPSLSSLTFALLLARKHPEALPCVDRATLKQSIQLGRAATGVVERLTLRAVDFKRQDASKLPADICHLLDLITVSEYLIGNFLLHPVRVFKAIHHHLPHTLPDLVPSPGAVSGLLPLQSLQKLRTLV